MQVGGRGVLIKYVNIAFIHYKTNKFYGLRLPPQRCLTQKTSKIKN